MATPPKIRVNTQVPFPAMVQASGSVRLTKQNGVYTVSLALGGSNNSIQFNSGGSLGGDTNFTWDSNAQFFYVNGTASINGTSFGLGDQVQIASTSNSIFGGYRFAASANGASISLAHSRNTTVGSHTALNANDIVGQIVFNGSDGAAYQTAATISGRIDGTVSSGIVPGRLVFKVTNTSGSLFEAGRFDNNGIFWVYNTVDSTTTNFEGLSLDWRTTSNTARISSVAGGTGTVRIIAIDGFSKAGAPANTDLPSGSWALIDDTSNNQTWLVFNKGGTIRKVQLT